MRRTVIFEIILLLCSIVTFANTVTIIGDSIILQVKKKLESIIPNTYINGEVGRQFTSLDKVVKKIERRNKLGDIVVIELGTNGDFELEYVYEMINYLEKQNKKVVLITVASNVPWRENVNEKLRKIAKNNRNIILLDWYSYSLENCYTDRCHCFVKDRVHLSKCGQEIFANFLANNIIKIIEGR